MQPVALIVVTLIPLQAAHDPKTCIDYMISVNVTSKSLNWAKHFANNYDVVNFLIDTASRTVANGFPSIFGTSGSNCFDSDIGDILNTESYLANIHGSIFHTQQTIPFLKEMSFQIFAHLGDIQLIWIIPEKFYLLLDEAASTSSKAFTTLCSCNQVVPDPLLALALNSSSVSCVSAKIFFVFIALFSCTTFNNFTACGLRVSSYSFSAFKISPEEGFCNAVSGKTDMRARYRA